MITSLKPNICDKNHKLTSTETEVLYTKPWLFDQYCILVDIIITNTIK